MYMSHWNKSCFYDLVRPQRCQHWQNLSEPLKNSLNKDVLAFGDRVCAYRSTLNDVVWSGCTAPNDPAVARFNSSSANMYGHTPAALSLWQLGMSWFIVVKVSGLAEPPGLIHSWPTWNHNTASPLCLVRATQWTLTADWQHTMSLCWLQPLPFRKPPPHSTEWTSYIYKTASVPTTIALTSQRSQEKPPVWFRPWNLIPTGEAVNL